MGNITAQSLGVGIKSSLGYNFIPDAIQEQQSQISTIQSDIQAVVNNNSLLALQQNERNVEFLYGLVEQKGEILRSSNQLANQLLWEKESSNDLLILFLFGLVMALFIYDITK